jgi:prepilin-type N-terminal cleavage/methylation domain-containing protein
LQQLRMPVTAQRGVTLLEIMFAIAMIAVLSAIAVPAYRAHLERVDLSRAIGDVHDIVRANNGAFVGLGSDY